MSAVLQSIAKPKTVDQLVADWIEAKRAEDVANKARIALEAEIIAAVGEPDEGSATHELVDGSKLTITAKITRTVDEAVWRSIMAQVPEAMRPITFVEEAKLDLKGLRWLQANQPEIYAFCARAITAKKAKTAVSLKV